MNLKELLKDKKLPVKVRLQDWDKTSYFEIISFNGHGAVGYSNIGLPLSYSFHATRWELYQEPKQKTVLSEYLAEIFYNRFLSVFFKSDEEFLKEFPRHPIIKTGRTIEVELS